MWTTKIASAKPRRNQMHDVEARSITLASAEEEEAPALEKSGQGSCRSSQQCKVRWQL
jgi:hypothetical protein